MNTIKKAIGSLFGLPVQDMSFPSYFQYVNERGKITARSLLDMMTIVLTELDEQEKRNAQYEESFKEIENILEKIVTGGNNIVITKVEDIPEFLSASHKIVEVETYTCDTCRKGFTTKIALSGHKRSHKKVEI